jgi:serine/threonine protein kinase
VIVNILNCIIRGLYSFYKQRIAHHDIKPENIFRDKDYIFKLGIKMLLFIIYCIIGDFGNVKTFDNTIDGNEFLGTMFFFFFFCLF